MTRRLVEAVARELSALADQLRAFYDSAFIETAAPRRWLLPLLPAAVVVAVAITWRRCKRRERDWRATGTRECDATCREPVRPAALVHRRRP